MSECYQLGPIRPPNEAYSLLVRATINCPWNRCKFCPVYKGQKFRLRTVVEVQQDIDAARIIRDKIQETAWQAGYGDNLNRVAAGLVNNAPDPAFHNVALWLSAGGNHAFLQDADSLIMPTTQLVEVVRYLKQTFPDISRITSYARSRTVTKKTLQQLAALYHAGLSRLHIGLESGYDRLLAYMDKGVTAADHIKAGQRVAESGITLSEYVILGLGGRQMWREHALETAQVLNEISPDVVRVRTIAINRRMPLYNEVVGGNFFRASDDEIITEERLLIERLHCRTNYVSDHITNLLPELEGELPQDRERMLAIIDRFQSLDDADRANFILGRRLGVYYALDDLEDAARYQAVDRIEARIGKGNDQSPEEVVYSLMGGFI